MPASRSARAMTFAPRSWPSRPGLAMTTLIFWRIFHRGLTARTGSDYRRFDVFPPDLAQAVAHLPDGRIRTGRVQQKRHRIRAAAGSGLERRQRPADLGGIAPCAQLLEPGQLTLACRLIDVKRTDAFPRLDEVIDADDDLLLRLDGLLRAVRAVGDLTLRVAPLDSLHHPAHRVDRFEIGQRLFLELRGQRLEEIRAAQRIGQVGDAGFVRDDLLRS